MPIIGFAFNSFEGSRGKVPATGEIKVNSTPKILDIKEIHLPNMKEKALTVDWEFITEYEPRIGSLRIAGSILYMSKDNRPILAKWKKDKTLPEEQSVEVLNHLFRRCLLKTSLIADDLQLPPPLNFPLVKKK
ncbi:MAG: hypothetical protein ABIH90_00135 [Candidatus Aenigmatarchaeota archaeon]